MAPTRHVPRARAVVERRPAVAPVQRSAAQVSPVGALRARVGNHGAQALLVQRASQGAVPGHMQVSSPNDPAEREAESVAHAIVRMEPPKPGESGPRVATSPAASVRRHVVHRQAEGDTAGQLDIEAALEAGADAGTPLPDPVRAYMEPRFDASFAQVRIHDDAHAHALSHGLKAHAFTVGRDIYFASGRYAPQTQTGRELLAHELTHTIQQGTAGSSRRKGAQRVVQREADGDGGVFGGIAERLSGLASGLRSGWDSIAGAASGALETVRGGIEAAQAAAGAFATNALAALRSGWTQLEQFAVAVVQGLRSGLQGFMTPLLAFGSTLANAIKRLDPNAVRATWNALLGTFGQAQQFASQLGQTVIQRTGAAWDALSTQTRAALAMIPAMIRDAFASVQTLVVGLRRRLDVMFDAMAARATSLFREAARIPEAVRAVIGHMASVAGDLWSQIQRQWTALRARLENAVQQAADRGTQLQDRLRQRAAAAWSGVAAAWTRVRSGIAAQVARLARSVRNGWTLIRNLPIARLMGTLTGLARVYRLIANVYEDLRGFFMPYAVAINQRIFNAMPGTALGFASQQLARAGGGAALGASTPAVATATPARTAQREVDDRRGNATWSEIDNGFWSATKLMWERVTWKALLDMVLNMLLELLIPPVAIYRQLKGFIFEDMAALVDQLYKPRNLFDDPEGFFDDLYTNLLHLVSDFVLSLLRRLIHILMSFLGWITFMLTWAGGVGGATVVGILGGILGFLAGFGIGAGPGAAAGATVGGAAGAGVGFGVALLIGEAMFFAYLAIQTTTVLALLLDLRTARQTDDEKRRDYLQLAESAVAVGVGLALLLLAWLAGKIAQGIPHLLRAVGIRPNITLPPAVSRFLRGLGSTRKPAPDGPTTGEQVARLLAEQRLSREIGGALARRLVADLGPQAAEAFVARVGANNVVRLGAELPTDAMLIVGQLERATLERLLDHGMPPRHIHAAIGLNQANRLAALTAEQIARLGRLSSNGFARIIGLPDAQFARLVALSDAQLVLFADMEANALARFLALDDAVFARFSVLSAAQLRAFSEMTDDAFARFVALDAADFAKFRGLPPEAIARMGNLSNAAFARYVALPPGQIVMFGRVQQQSLERLATQMRPGDLERLAAQMDDGAVHREVLGRDPANQRFRGNEADTALRLERQRGIVLDRFQNVVPDPRGRPGPDWIDRATGQTYDGCSPGPRDHFNPGQYEASLQRHYDNPNYNFIVIDTTGLNLTGAQLRTLQQIIDRVAGPASPRIIRIR